ncbi:NUDIX domain-containing protein [Desulfoscipio geothermicus]|uniref:ADP-ribose pyrophosphatase YjhB, NUDIX family n=1 Tax=Desulfoscipio geothermicus DSM 3669 TaxID=1121426 RepID=A0A1I6E694_9FIRM|nr:NUDIX domain-containing protein [Desulfoscipio geothermicus]SFR13269.1 ADP-ribose pyrophosphatase YjhB, NUDIX family [Desulfoscipio geothermicus DSM 3669]
MAHNRKQRFFFCPKCGGKLYYCDNHGQPRLTCASCTYIFFENPVAGVAAIVLNDKKQILLGRRKNGNYAGLWCIPCGFVEYDEDVYHAVRREFKEETNLDIEVVRVYTVQSNFHDPECHTVGIWFLARVTGGELLAGDDLAEAGYFNLDNIPPLAFPTDRVIINKLFEELYINEKKEY